MVCDKKYFKPHINKEFQKFIDNYDTTITKLLNIVNEFKHNCVNSYEYSDKHPPINPKYKYTDKLYIACIFYIVFYNTSWVHFLGPISGSQVNKRHNEYLKYGVYKKFFDGTAIDSIRFHEKNNINSIKYIITDTTVNNNKLCKDIHKHYPINKNRKGIKVSFLINHKRSILGILVDESAVHDSRFSLKHIDNFFKQKHIMKIMNKHKNKITFLADSAYDSKEIKSKLALLGVKHIICPNNRRRKIENKIYLNKVQKKKYKNRIVIEHKFGSFKRYARINCVYESRIKSYLGLCYLMAGILNLKNMKRA